MNTKDFLKEQKELLKAEALMLKIEKNNYKNAQRERRIQKTGETYPDLLLLTRINNLRHIIYSLIKNIKSDQIQKEMKSRLKLEIHNYWYWNIKKSGFEDILSISRANIILSFDDFCFDASKDQK